MIYGSVGLISGLLRGVFLKFTPSMPSHSSFMFGFHGRGRRPAKFVDELLRAMFSFSACIPRIFGTVTKVGGGVGGTSPVIRT